MPELYAIKNYSRALCRHSCNTTFDFLYQFAALTFLHKVKAHRGVCVHSTCYSSLILKLLFGDMIGKSLLPARLFDAAIFFVFGVFSSVFLSKLSQLRFFVELFTRRVVLFKRVALP